jgi:opacity protein-like surface antigen
MKIPFRLTTVGSTLLLAAVQSRAQSADKLYLDVSAGPAITQDAAIKVSDFGNSGNVRFDVGPRIGLNLGYDLTPSFAAELESGMIWNGVRSIQPNNLSTFGASADIYEIPMLVNVIYKPLHGAFQPYVGVGCGGAATIFDSSNIPLYGPSFSATDWTFAYQAEVGFKYSVSRKVELGLAYKFLGTSDHDWTDAGHELKTDGTMTHAIMATFTWQF